MTKHILIVDDTPTISRQMQVHLEQAGFRVSLSINGAEALQRLRQKPEIDLIATDVTMPVMDGFEFLSRLRQQSDFTSIPVILIGYPRNEVSPDDPPNLTLEDIRQEMRGHAIECGATEYLVRPFHPIKLVQMVQEFLTSGSETK